MLEYSISCKNCGYSLSDILNYTALAPTKENELLIIQSSFIAEAPKPEPETSSGQEQPPAPKKPRKVRFQLTSKDNDRAGIQIASYGSIDVIGCRQTR